jgi:ribosomal protein L18
MTAKDFAAIAAVLAAYRMDPSVGTDALAENMADALARTNPRFDRARFLAACRVPDVSKAARDRAYQSQIDTEGGLG